MDDAQKLAQLINDLQGISLDLRENDMAEDPDASLTERAAARERAALALDVADDLDRLISAALRG